MTATTLGYVTRTDIGAFRGPLRTLSFRGDIDVTPISDKTSPAHPDYKVSASGVEVGAGWVNINQTTGKPYVRLVVAHPDISPRTIKINLGRAAGQDDDDVFALIWNPED